MGDKKSKKHKKHKDKESKKAKKSKKLKKNHKRERSDSSESDASDEVQAPSSLSSLELAMARQQLIKLLTAFPQVKGELVRLLMKVDGGDAVIIDGIPDEELKSHLRAVFECLKLEQKQRPSGSVGYRRCPSTPVLVDYFEDVFRMYFEPVKASSSHAESKQKSHKKKKHKRKEKDMSSEDEEDDEPAVERLASDPDRYTAADAAATDVSKPDLSVPERLPATAAAAAATAAASPDSVAMPPPASKRRAPAFPALPSAAQLAEAKEQARLLEQKEKEEAELDALDSFGPRLPGQMTAMEQQAMQALRVARALEAEHKAIEAMQGSKAGREEWMTELPPELQTAGLDKDMKGRKFRMSQSEGRGDATSWTDSPAERERKARRKAAEDEVNNLMQIATAGMTRGAGPELGSAAAAESTKEEASQHAKSLMEIHLEREQKKRKKEEDKEREASKAGKKKYKVFEWNRDEAMGKGQRGQMSEKNRKELLKQASNLGMRFSNTGQKTSFL